MPINDVFPYIITDNNGCFLKVLSFCLTLSREKTRKTFSDNVIIIFSDNVIISYH